MQGRAVILISKLSLDWSSYKPGLKLGPAASLSSERSTAHFKCFSCRSDASGVSRTPNMPYWVDSIWSGLQLFQTPTKACLLNSIHPIFHSLSTQRLSSMQLGYCEYGRQQKRNSHATSALGETWNSTTPDHHPCEPFNSEEINCSHTFCCGVCASILAINIRWEMSSSQA